MSQPVLLLEKPTTANGSAKRQLFLTEQGYKYTIITTQEVEV